MDPAEEFLEAVRKGDVAKVEEMLRIDPARAAARDPDGVSAILLGTYYRQPRVVEALLERGPKLDLYEASAVGNLARVKELVEEKPNLVNSYSPDGFMPLGLAAFFGHGAIVQFLLRRKAEVNLPSKNDLRLAPLHSAVANGDIAIVKLLLGRGADVNARQAGGYTPLHEAALQGRAEMVKLFLYKEADTAAESDEGKTALDLASERGQKEVAELLRRHA